MVEVVMYWRPGCPFCAQLERDLHAAEVDFHKVNIWEHPKAAEIVRRLANGNETVPTITVGDLAFVNPSIEAITSALESLSAP